MGSANEMLLWRHEVNDSKTSRKKHCAVKHLLNNLSHNVTILFPNIAREVARTITPLLPHELRQKLPINNSSFRALDYLLKPAIVNHLIGELQRKSALTFSLLNAKPHDAIHRCRNVTASTSDTRNQDEQFYCFSSKLSSLTSTNFCSGSFFQSLFSWSTKLVVEPPFSSCFRPVALEIPCPWRETIQKP